MLCCFIGLFFSVSLHGQSLRNQTLAAMGTTVHSSQGEGLRVQQSIGQSSVTGVFASSFSIRLSQGFLRGGIALSKEIKPAFAVIAFPNAFAERVRFRFTTEHTEATALQVIDMQGKLVYEASHTPIQKEIEVNLPFLAPGVYLVHLRSGNKFVQTRIIKKP
jgi:hypothetical protein